MLLKDKVLVQNIEDLDTDEQRTKFKELCPTHWVQRHDSVIIFTELLEAVANALEDIKLLNDSDTASGACLLLNSNRQPHPEK